MRREEEALIAAVRAGDRTAFETLYRAYWPPWEAYIGVRLSPPEIAESIERNPLGVYITSITWTRVGAPA